jgi:hypothetical protein
MNNNGRTREASSLRTFFDDQINHLQNLVNTIHEERQQAEQEKQIVETFVEVSNNKMRAVQDYADKLRDHVRTLYRHVLQVADEIPPPVNLDSFGTDTLINALFVNSKDIEELLKTDPNVKDFLQTYDEEQAPILYALLTAHRDEKQILGMVMQGDMLLRDVSQEAVNFSAHKIHKPCISDTELNTVLKEYLFVRVVELIKKEMLLHIPEPTFNADKSYQATVNSMANPDVYLAKLIDYIQDPSQLLGINKLHFKLSKLGIKLDENAQQSANEFTIHELNWRDNLRVVVLQITHHR